MRVATYTQPAAMTRRSVVGVMLLVVTVLLGSTAVFHLVQQLAPGLSGVVTLAWLGIYALALGGLMIGHGVNWISWLVRYRLLLVILMLGTIASISWALDTRLSLERVVHLSGSTLIAIYIGFTVPLLTTLRVLAVTLGVLFVASLLAVFALPAVGIEDYAGQAVWRGVFNTKNTIGFWAAIGVLLYVTLSDSVHTFAARILCYLMVGVCMALLVFSHSATSLVALLLAGGLSFYLFVALRFRLGFVRMVVLAILLGGLAVFAVSNIGTAELVGRSDDLTGRGEVWAQTWRLIMQRPATGFGYGVLWFPSGDNSWIQETLTDFTWTVHHAHNGFLQVASEVGLPLAVVALLMIVQQLVEIFYCQYQRQQPGVLFVLAFTVAYLVSNVAEARFLVNRELFWILFIALPISMLRQINLTHPERSPASVSSAADITGPVGSALAPVSYAPARSAAATGAGLSVRVPVPAHSDSPWIALAAEQQRRADEQAEQEPNAALEGATDDGFDELADQPSDRSSDDGELDESWNEVDFDATLESLTLLDADIDLGTAGTIPESAADPDQEMADSLLDALDDVELDARLHELRDDNIEARLDGLFDDGEFEEQPVDTRDETAFGRHHGPRAVR